MPLAVSDALRLAHFPYVHAPATQLSSHCIWRSVGAVAVQQHQRKREREDRRGSAAAARCYGGTRSGREGGNVDGGGRRCAMAGVATGGVEDAYGEDRATEDQPVTPWAVCVASGYSLLRDPRHNKGLSFTEKERDVHYLRGLLPPVVLPQELQEKRLLQNVRQLQVPLQRYVFLMDLQARNERLFYKLMIDNVEELLPVVYTPTVGEACQKYGSIFRRSQGLYIKKRSISRPGYWE